MRGTEKMKMYIRKSGMKQKDVADLAGMDPKTLSLIMTGRRELKADEFISLCRVLKLDIKDFETEEVA